MRQVGLLGLLVVLSAPLAAQQSASTTSPDSASFITEDISRFWAAWDRMATAATRQDSVRALFEEYYLPASPGLIGFIRSRIGSVYDLLATLEARREYYASLRATTRAIQATAPLMRSQFHRLLAEYPAARFPDVYFLIGRMNSGGTPGARGLYIGSELYSLAPDTPMGALTDWERSVTRTAATLPCIVMHELIHYQQPRANPQTLLHAAFVEGSADFVAERYCEGNINSHVHQWVAAEPGREALLLGEFLLEKDGGVTNRWLYGGGGFAERPADLGYYMGYRIAKAYYDRATDKAAALRDILTTTDPAPILAGSGLVPLP